jgi:[glutamine synthetase] adenylyltransferase / [glutamine synthetase]-adenylyl-L-tyrosine phosphorylase
LSSPEVLGRALAAAPDPEMARIALTRVGERAEARHLLAEPALLEPAVLLLGLSSAAADFLVAHPEECSLFTDLSPRSERELVAEAGEAVELLGPRPGLRRFRRRALYRVAAMDLRGTTFEDVVAEVSSVAEACLRVAADLTLDPDQAVIGMGKLGGWELNYASDVDVVFVHGGTGAAAQEEAARRASRFVAVLAEPTEDGVALRVDASLRPEGRAGPLSRSRDATLEYYRRHAATWEKQALLKARPVAGAIDLGGGLLEQLADVVFPEDLEPSAIEDVRSMKVRIEEYVRARGKEAVEVKRGRGGIRDVEFAVQLLQLVHGRRDPRLRQPNTLRALGTLAEEGYVAVADAEALAGSYRFLRTLEHRLQLAREVQTHELPGDRASLRMVARAMGLDGPDTLRRAHEMHVDVVRGLHERLFYRPLLEAFAGPSVPQPGLERSATVELLGGLGFRDPEAAYVRLDRLVDPATRLGKVLGHAFPVVGPALALAPDPDTALVRLERVLEGLAGDPGAPDVLASDPEATRRLVLAVGASSWLADRLAGDPEGVRVLGLDRGAVQPKERLLAIGAHYAAREVGVPEVGRELSDVADAVVEEALAAAPTDLPFAVIGLGKLGGRELNFASDLDVVFVYDGEGAGPFEEARRAAEAVLESVRRRGFEADADLRPEGRSGPLARSMVAFLEYWERWGRTWEFQSLLKTRFVAGDPSLGRRFLSSAADFAYPEYLSIDRIAEIRRMRVRMESERVKPPDARRFHFKLGHGGLADVQFAVELAQMRHGAEHPEVRPTNTLEALEALARERLVEDSVSLALGEAYVFLNEVKNAMELDRRVHAEAVPPSAEGQLELARRMGYEEYPRQRFLEDYRRITRRARRAMERVFYPDEE